MKIKTHNLSLLLVFGFFILLLTAGCQSNTDNDTPEYATSGSKYKDTTGPISVITVVADTTVYQGIYPFLIQEDILGKPLPATLVPQSFFGFRNYTPKGFEKRNTSRMVLYLKKGEPSYESKPSIYAKGQAFIEISGNNLGDIKNQIQIHQKEMVREFERANFDYLFTKMDNDHADELEKIGVYMNIPEKYHLVQEKENYQWYRLDNIHVLNARNESTGGKVGTQAVENFNIQVEKFPLEKEQLSKEDFKGIINGYGLNRLKSETEGNYMEIQQDFYYIAPVLESESYLLYDFDGMWEMKNEKFGGSFVGRLILDKKSQTAYFTLVSINAPNLDRKRDNIMHALSMVKSFKVLKK